MPADWRAWSDSMLYVIRRIFLHFPDIVGTAQARKPVINVVTIELILAVFVLVRLCFYSIISSSVLPQL